MNNSLPIAIALRYLISKKAHKVVNIISAISIAGVAVATAAIVVVLSVFNGFENLSERQLSKINPDIRISPASGKVIANADSIAASIANIAGIKAALPVISERAMLVDRHTHLPVVFKAIPEGYEAVMNLDSMLIDGEYYQMLDSLPAIQLSIGAANRSGLRPFYGETAELYVPRRIGRINPANPAASFRNNRFAVTAVYETEYAEEDNDRVIIPLWAARQLLGYDSEATSIDIAVDSDATIDEVVAAVSNSIGSQYITSDRRMLEENSYRMIEIEKWVTFMMLVFILLIATFNIISALSLLIAEKKDDATTLRSIGASKNLIRRIFIYQGFVITVAGGLIGIVVGVALSLIQQIFGVIKLAGDPAALTIDVYPVAVKPADVLVVMAAVILVALLTSQITRIFTKNATRTIS